MAIEVFGFVAVASMVTMYALEQRSHVFVAGFAASCAAASLYAVLIHSWPFAIVEGMWAVVALRRWVCVRPGIVGVEQRSWRPISDAGPSYKRGLAMAGVQLRPATYDSLHRGPVTAVSLLRYPSTQRP